MKKLLVLLLLCGSARAQIYTDPTDSVPSFRLGSQFSLRGIYTGVGVGFRIPITETNFSFRPGVEYFGQWLNAEDPYQNSHMRITPIDLTLVYGNFSASVSSGTILPVPALRHLEPGQWGYLPFLSARITRRFKRWSWYGCVDSYRAHVPVFRHGMYIEFN